MENQAYEDNVTMKRVGMVVAVLIGMTFGLMFAVTIIT